MQMALYTPELGFYCKQKINIGSKGDFTTAPQISSIFGKCIAVQCAEILKDNSVKNNKIDSILEIGAGTGKLALDVLNKLKEINCLPEVYYIKEISKHLIKIQKQQLQQFICDNKENIKIKWLDEESAENINAIVIANELLDALACNRIKITNNQNQYQIMEYHVGINNNNEFGIKFLPIENKVLEQESQKAFQQLQQNYSDINLDLKEINLDYTTEINLELNKQLDLINKTVNQGVIFFLDYGYSNKEYFHPERSHGTLKCFKNHKSHDDALKDIGMTDITSHVNFSYLAECADRLGFSILGYNTQANFLINNKLNEISDEIIKELNKLNIDDNDLKLKQNKIIQEIQTLCMPYEMGETIKVMAISKDIDMNLRSFSQNNILYKL